jgi:hypothetical protein
VRRALAGLGFSGPEGPNADDRVFVSDHFLAWIDQTGFYGKMNGLWLLNGAAGDALDFVVKDPDGRPVSMLLPGENGEGRFSPGYQGAEHLEFPNRTPEADDDPSCSKSDWCNQYSLAEAVPITNPRIPWWSACNVGRPSFDTKHDPVIAETLPDGGLKLVYEGPLTKEADGDPIKDGDACHEDYLFPDRVRRRVTLRVGYELHPHADYIDRTQQLVNAPGNPELAGDLSLIGGFIMTEFPSPHYLKRWNRFWRPERSTVELKWNRAPVTLAGGTWTRLVGLPLPREDILVAWANQPFSVAGTDALVAHRSATIENVGPSDNADVGACLCVTHGGIELGGGLLHAGESLPISAGQATIEARRRLTFSNGLDDARIWSRHLELQREGGLLRAPAATDYGAGALEAVFTVETANREDVVIAIYDATAGELVGRRPANHAGRITLDASLDEREGHALEPRVYWSVTAEPPAVSGVTINVTDR